MRRLTHFVLLALVCTVPLFTGCHPSTIEIEEETPHLNHRYVSAEEGRQILLSNTDYFNSLTQNDIDWKYRSTGKTLDEMKTFAADQIQEFTEEEKKALDAIIRIVEIRFDALGIALPTTEEITFVKSTMESEGWAGAFTLGYSVFLNAYIVQTISDLFQGKEQLPYLIDYNEYLFLYFPDIIAHELFHCLSRNDANFRQKMYSLIGFTVMDHDVEFGPTVSNILLKNPDVERYDNWAEFTIDGEKHRCILVGVYDQTFAEAKKTDPEATFFYHWKSVLVPLDDPDTMIPIEQASDFYQILGHNTDYFMAAEEYMADNFGYLIGSGTSGYHDYIDGKVQFVPYKTPKLIQDIHKTLKELFPK